MKLHLHISKGNIYSPSSERVEKRQFRPLDMSFPSTFLRKLFGNVHTHIPQSHERAPFRRRVLGYWDTWGLRKQRI